MCSSVEPWIKWCFSISWPFSFQSLHCLIYFAGCFNWRLLVISVIWYDGSVSSLWPACILGCGGAGKCSYVTSLDMQFVCNILRCGGAGPVWSSAIFLCWCLLVQNLWGKVQFSSLGAIWLRVPDMQEGFGCPQTVCCLFSSGFQTLVFLFVWMEMGWPRAGKKTCILGYPASCWSFEIQEVIVYYLPVCIDPLPSLTPYIYDEKSVIIRLSLASKTFATLLFCTVSLFQSSQYQDILIYVVCWSFALDLKHTNFFVGVLQGSLRMANGPLMRVPQCIETTCKIGTRK